MQRNSTTHKLPPIRYAAKAYSGAAANYSQHKSELYIAVLAVCNESLWLAFSATFLFSDAHSISYLARFSPHNDILWNWSHLLCFYDLTIVHIPATYDVVAGFADLFTRCLATLRKTMKAKIGAHRVQDTPLISFHGLAPMRIHDMLAILQRFIAWFDNNKLNSAEVRTAWKEFAGFPKPPQLTARMASSHAYYNSDTGEWVQFQDVRPLSIPGVVSGFLACQQYRAWTGPGQSTYHKAGSFMDPSSPHHNR